MEGPRKLETLDGLRGFAALLVVVFHYRLTCGRVAEPTWFARGLLPFRFGFSGVNLFLVLSGFCLTLSLARRRAADASPTFRAFLLDRWRRIAPPFYAAMVVYLAAAPALQRLGVPATGGTSQPVRQVWTHLAFLHGLFPETICGVNDPFWSLSLEFQFYATLPLLFAMGLKFGPWRVLAVVAVLSLVWRAWILGRTPNRFYAVNGFLLARWGEFALGGSIASWYARPSRRGPGVAPLGGSALLLLAIGSWLSYRDRVLWSDYAYGLGYGALLTSVLLSAERGGRLGALFAWRPLAWTGSVSYSLYLTHSLVLALALAACRAAVPAPGPATDLTALVLALAGSLFAAWWFARVFEAPWHRRRALRAAVTAPQPQPA